MGYLLVAYGVFWVFTFAFVLSIAVRQRRLQKDLDALSAALEERR